MKNLFFSIPLIALLSACNDSSPSVVVPDSFETKQLVAIMRNPQKVSLEEVAKIAETSASKIRVYSENISEDASNRAILFSWETGEKRSIQTQDGEELNLKGFDSMGLGYLRRTSKADFQNRYESPSTVQNEINRLVTDQTIDTDIAIAEAKSMAAMAKTQQFEKLENVAELSYWETPVNALHIFADGIAFTITTNLVNEAQSREKAIELASLIFDHSLNFSR